MAEPRRSQRERKAVDRLSTKQTAQPKSNKAKSRRPTANGDTEDESDLTGLSEHEGADPGLDSDGQAISDPEEEGSPEEEPGNDSDYAFGRPTPKGNRFVRNDSRGKRGRRRAPPNINKRPRSKAKPGARPSARRLVTSRQGGSGEEQAVEAEAKDLGLKGEYDIAHDNNLYNALRSGSAALQSTVDDWWEEYQAGGEGDEGESARGKALASLITAILRACGCNASVDEHESLDLDAVTDTLETVQDDFRKVPNKAYPIIARSRAARSFRSALAEFFSRLVQGAHLVETLYDATFCITLQTWLAALSSSPLRAFRHTATVIGLNLVSDVAALQADRVKELSTVTRQVDAERKKSRTDKARLKDFEKNQRLVHEHKEHLEKLMKELFDEIFIHRYRDANPHIRVDCVKALGSWMKKNPTFFLEGSYLRYLGWVLTDNDKDARHEALRALTSLYAKEDNIGGMQNFTQRFRARLIEMATGEPDLAVRIQAIGVVQLINRHGLLADGSQRGQLASLIFHEEGRVRRAVAPFIASLVQDAFDDRRAEFIASDGKAPPAKKRRAKAAGKQEAGEAAETRLRFKCLALVLSEQSTPVDRPPSLEDDTETRSDASEMLVTGSLGLIAADKGRTALAIEALWDEVEVVKNWAAMADYLLLDHSSNDAAEGDQRVEDVCRLEEGEESLLVEILVASLRHVQVVDKQASEDTAEDVSISVTQEMMRTLPRLLSKYQADPRRTAEILQIPRLMNLDLYLDMRMVSAFEALWSDLTKQFVKHQDARALESAVDTMHCLLQVESLRQVSITKASELDEAVLSGLSVVIAGRDVETAAFEDDEIASLQASLTRIAKLFTFRDLSLLLEVHSPDAANTILHLTEGLAGRGALGYRDEEKVVETALQILFSNMMWNIARLREGTSKPVVANILRLRDRLLDQLRAYAIGPNTNACDSVQRTAFVHFINVLLLCQSAVSGPDFSVECDEQTQSRLAGFMQAAIERQAADLPDAEEEAAVPRTTTQNRKARKGSSAKGPPRHGSLLGQGFSILVTTYTRAIRAGLLSIEQAAVILPHYTRFDTLFDHCARTLAETLRDEVFGGRRADRAVKVWGQCLEEAINLYLNDETTSADAFAHLSRLVQTAIIIRGPQLTIPDRLDATLLVKLHVEAIQVAVQRAASLETAQRDADKAKAIAMFRGLGNMLAGATGRDALVIKAAMDRSIEDAGLGVPNSSKAWEPYNAYNKKLLSLMTKDPSVKNAARKANEAGGNVESEADPSSDSEKLVEDMYGVQRLKPNQATISKFNPPKSTEAPVRRSKRNHPTESEGEARTEAEDDHTSVAGDVAEYVGERRSDDLEHTGGSPLKRKRARR